MRGKPAKLVWETALGELQLQVTRSNYDLWLKDTVGVVYEDDLFVVGAPSAFATDWLEKRLHSLIRKTLIGLLGHSVQVRFSVHQTPASRGRSRLAQSQEEPAAEARTLELPETPGTVDAVGRATQLHPHYTFASFVVGSSNRLAHAAALNAAERPGKSYNPLFIYGGTGLGKTHLLHAIGHHALARGRQVLLVSSEQFTNDFIVCIRGGRNEEFRAKYRQAALLLIDDVQFLADKEKSQEEFFHTFNDLHGASRQIVLTSDRPPKSMPLLEDRLASRFAGGLVADIQPPDLETRLAILYRKVEEQGMAVPREVLEYIAHRVQSNIRDLEGALNRVLAHAQHNGAAFSPELAAQVLEEVASAKGYRHRLAPAQILGIVADSYRMEPEEIVGKRRDKKTALARQVCMYLLREESPLSFAEIGRQLGGRDHSTVLHGYVKIAAEIEASPRLRREILRLREALYQPKA